MALTKRGKWWHAESAADLDEYLLKKVLGPLQRGKQHHVAHAKCHACGKNAFDLFTDDGDRVMRQCTACEAEHRICNLDEEFDYDSCGEIVCTCMYSECEVAVGFALIRGKGGKRKAAPAQGVVTYLYVAGRCTHCGLCGVYTEWSVPRTFLAKTWFDSV